jgi:hypothetical protein
VGSLHAAYGRSFGLKVADCNAFAPDSSKQFGKAVAYGQINKTYHVTHLNVKEASRRYSPAQVIAVTRDTVTGEPEQISTSYVERSHLTLRQSCKRFQRLGNGFSKRLEHQLCGGVATRHALQLLPRA